jgi:adenylate cyclase
MTKRKRILAAAPALALGLAAGAAVCGARALGWMEGVELAAYDALVRAGPRDGSCVGRVLVVGIDEADLRQPGAEYPVPDGRLADLLRRLLAMRPAAVGVDLFRDRPVFDRAGDAAVNRRGELRDLWEAHDNLVFVFEVGERDGGGPAAVAVPPPPGLDALQAGFADVPVDRDGRVRRARALLPSAGPDPGYASLPLQVAAAAVQGGGGGPPASSDGGLRLGDGTLPYLPVAEGAYAALPAKTTGFLLDWRTPLDRLAVRPARDVLAGAVPAAEVEGRVVLVGMTAASVKDHLETPLGTTWGVLVHAMTVDQLLRTAAGGAGPPRTAGRAAEGWLAVAAGLLGAVVALRARRPARLLGVAAAALALAAAAGWAAFRGGWWLPAVPVAAAGTAAAGLATVYLSFRHRADRLAVGALFARHVSPGVADAIWEHRAAILAGGRLRPRRLRWATVVFTDLEGYSAVAERLPPGEVLDLLNELSTALTACVAGEGGFVNKYMGDGMMAVFGAPVPRDAEADARADARAAVRCALAMRAAFGDLAARWRARGLPAVRMRVGVYSGEAVAGSIGGAGRLEYTVTGDAVNTAARVEQYGKDDVADAGAYPGGCRVLVGRPTLDLAGGGFDARFVADVRPRKMGKTVALYAVTGPAAAAAGGDGPEDTAASTAGLETRKAII